MLQKMPVPKEEGLALLPGSQIPQGFHKHAAEMLLLQPCRNGCMRLMVLPRSCIILVRAAVPAAIPPSSLQHCHCSPPVAPMTNSIRWKNKLSHLQTTVAPCPSSGQLHYLKMLGRSCKEHPTYTQRRHRGVSPEGSHRLAQ